METPLAHQFRRGGRSLVSGGAVVGEDELDLVGLAVDVNSGVSAFAYCIPRTSFLPPEAESPEVGSKTPILTTFSPEEAEAELSAGALLEVLPHAQSAKTITKASAIAMIFFIFCPSIIYSSQLGVSVFRVHVYLFCDITIMHYRAQNCNKCISLN